MQHQLVLFSLMVLMLTSFGFISQCTAPDQNDTFRSQNIQQEAATPELAEYMGTMQYYTHKFALATDAENQELATFYFNEIRALSEQIKKDIPGYEGYDIARFMGIFLDPAIQPVADALEGNDWEETRSQVLQLINSCNSCHNATSHGFVQVTPGFDRNPYNQDFSKTE